MIVMQVITTLKDNEGECFKRLPYLFGSEEEKTAWTNEFDSLVAELYCELRQPYARMDPLHVYYETDVPSVGAGLPEPPGHLIWIIRSKWYAGQLDLNTILATAA